MGDSYNDSHRSGRNSETRGYNRGNYRGGRTPGNRDNGGFRIRLSENEMRCARFLQETFNLRSTVAVLGFALRTLAEMIEQGKMDEFVKEYQSQNSKPTNSSRPLNGDRGNEDKIGSKFIQNDRPNPFARPSKPTQPSIERAEELNSEGINSTKTNPTNSENSQSEVISDSQVSNQDFLNEEKNS